MAREEPSLYYMSDRVTRLTALMVSLSCCSAKEVRTMRHPHIEDHDWDKSVLVLLGAFFVGIVVFALMVGGF